MRKQTIILVSVLLLLFGGPFVAYSAEGITYIVQPGDCLVKLAGMYLGNGAHYSAIVSATNEKRSSDGSFAKITDPFAIEPGWKLFIPAAGFDQRDCRISILVGGLGFPEGPIWDSKNETLYWVEWSGDAIWAMKDGKANIVVKTQKGDGPNGLCLDKDGNLWVAMYSSLKVVKMTPSGKILKTIDNYKGKPFKGPNDLVMDSKGGIYFTDSGDFEEDWTTGRPAGDVYYITPGGNVVQLDSNLCYSNGLGITPDGKNLLVNEHRANRIWKYSINPDGTLSNRRQFFILGDDCVLPEELCYEVGPDGMSQDSKGNVYVAHYGAGEVVVISPDGRQIRRIHLPIGSNPDNTTFGADEKTLYVTEGEVGLLYRIQFK